MPKNLYSVDPNFDHGQPESLGILVANLGTPEAPTAAALRPYLKQFLWDPRVVELSRPLWWSILHGIVLTFRPRRSAELYRNIWTEHGSPLLLLSQQLAADLETRLRAELAEPVHCALGMTYGEPSVARALAQLKERACNRLLVLPLYPHYSSTTVGSVFDAVAKELMKWRRVPELRTVHHYHDEPRYIAALASRVRQLWQRDGEPDVLVTSYHGIPQRYFDNGDPYHCECHKTSRLLAEALQIPQERVVVTFQSLFGREEWLKPYTEDTLQAMPKAGVRKVDVVCPGFAVDCLETIDEIDREYRHVFEEAGGETFRYIPCLNDDPDHTEMLQHLVLRHIGGWVGGSAGDDAESPAVACPMRAQRMRALSERGSPADAGYGQEQA